MYTLYRSPAAFYGCLITIVITLLSTTATPQKFLYYPLYIDIIASNTPQMKIKAVSQWTAWFNIQSKPEKCWCLLRDLSFGLFDQKKKNPRTFPKFQQNPRTFQDSFQIPGLSRTGGNHEIGLWSYAKSCWRHNRR